VRPFNAFGMRPTMLLAARSVEDARRLIDRGITADGNAAEGTAYLVSTSDQNRNVRARGYVDAKLMAAARIPVEIVQADAIYGRSDVMFYFTGLARVPGVGSNAYLPGAIADHLTSFGGDLAGSSQMSALHWLEAGATGSYGTVTEPCNIVGKFPNPGMVMKRYLAGETLIEAYWKSVAMPGQGLFIGEPLANPYGGYQVLYDGKDLLIKARGLSPGEYDVLGAQVAVGPYVPVVERLRIATRDVTIRIRRADLAFYQLRPRATVK
jgi:hypothetical protein